MSRCLCRCHANSRRLSSAAVAMPTPAVCFQLIKAEAGLVGGEVLFHQLVTKTEDEVEAIRQRREQREYVGVGGGGGGVDVWKSFA